MRPAAQIEPVALTVDFEVLAFGNGVDQLDLVVPMPTDRYVQAPNVMHIGMPFNPAPALPPADSPALRRLLASGWPRPWTALIVGGPTTRGELAPGHVADLARAASERALARVWKTQHFSYWMTTMLHTLPDASPFDVRRQEGELALLSSSVAGSTYLAEAYTGWPGGR